MKKIIGIVIGLVILGAIGNGIAQKAKQQPVKQNAPQQQQQTASPQKKEFDVSYGSNVRNTMHVVLPNKVSATTPLVLVIHGGAWTMGDKKDVLAAQQKFKDEGIASAAMSYRYASNSVHYTELMADVKSAVNYLEANAKDWGITTDHFAMAGISAGAHMSLLYSYAYDTENKVKAVISMAGPTDLTDVQELNQVVTMKMIDSLNKMVGDTYTVGKPLSSKFAAASPIKHIKNVPTLMIHGTADTLVLYQQATALNQALAAAGVPHKLMSIDGANHDMGLGNPITALKIGNEATAWIKQYTK